MLDEGEFAVEPAVVVDARPARAAVAVEGPEAQHHARLAGTLQREQCGLLALRRAWRREVQQRAVVQRQGAARAAQLLHDQRDLAQAALGGIRSQGGKALGRELLPQRLHACGFACPWHGGGGRPVALEEAAHRVAQQGALFVAGKGGRGHGRVSPGSRKI